MRKSMMSIESLIKKDILEQGYITLDHFLSLVIPFYYGSQESVGEHGDFITAPETSQLFGEMVGIYTANYWLKNCTNNITIVELGPGRGYLMSDFLRATKHIPGFHNSIDKIILYEISPKLRSYQQQNLTAYIDKCVWLDRLQELEQYISNNHCIFIANEFFDALPIKQFQSINRQWYELCLVLDQFQKFKVVPLIKIDSTSIQNNFSKSAAKSEFLEYSPSAKYYLEIIANSILTNHGLFLLIDYGYTNMVQSSTLQAVRNHKKVHFLDCLGQADITYLVNFSWLQNYFLNKNLKCTLTSQKDFLESCEIQQRAEQLINKYGADKQKINSQLKILLSPEKMGELFKCLVVNKYPHKK
ncbi:MAG: SAM-dependent methyltransferase [Candidatus Midichloria sp.]|nr:SAM-dependent methyltransferase [Candidatus Midichloria sp.]